MGNAPHLLRATSSVGGEHLRVERGERSGLRTTPCAGLGEDVAHVVARSLHADEEPFGDLCVRKPSRDEPQDLELAVGQHPDALATYMASIAEPAQQRTGDIRHATG